LKFIILAESDNKCFHLCISSWRLALYCWACLKGHLVPPGAGRLLCFHFSQVGIAPSKCVFFRPMPTWNSHDVFFCGDFLLNLLAQSLNVSSCLLQVVSLFSCWVRSSDSDVSQRRWKNAAAFAHSALKFQFNVELATSHELFNRVSLCCWAAVGYTSPGEEWAVKWTTWLCALLLHFWSHENANVITRPTSFSIYSTAFLPCSILREGGQFSFQLTSSLQMLKHALDFGISASLDSDVCSEGWFKACFR